MAKRILNIILLLMAVTLVHAQQYTATEGLLHVPSADMDSAGVIRVGAHYMPKVMMPESMTCDGEKFNSASYYLSFTPFEWVQVSVTGVLWKLHKDGSSDEVGYNGKDRHFSARLRPLKEGKYWPSVVIGSDDLWGSGDDGKTGSGYFRNYYLTATKHFDLGGNLIGTHLGYRKWKRDYNRKWDGLIGGLTFQPAFYRHLRVIAEWTGNEVNAGADCRIPLPFAGPNTAILLQAGLLNARDFFCGLSLAIDLTSR